jgi:peptidyl-tRNA hydrolase, PTH1 family
MLHITIESMYYIVGLGNPGEEYDGTRHNTGRIVLNAFRKKHGFPEWEVNKKLLALVSKGAVGKEEVCLIEPQTYMNKSGQSLGSMISSAKKAEKLIVIQDELDLGIGTFKITFNRGSGGHRGVESIMKAIKTEGFVRVRVGISPVTPTGKVKKPTGDNVVGDFILAQFKKPEQELLKKVSKKVTEAVEMIILEGRVKAMGEFN